MKQLLLLWLFSGSLDGFCQDTSPTTLRSGYLIRNSDSIFFIPSTRNVCTFPYHDTSPDTLRATLVVYYDRGGPAILHTKPGFVVTQFEKDYIYLDDKKRVIKAPFEVVSFKLKNKQQ